ncbi:SDR family oxidoreductase [Siccirubricoccus sp. KC 17139]|uniref:SDR family oxidoreductase n=1 Tax=Siccirubricoccus soli TaxID=2899147 RepID=A0ABT1D1B8_9PROT|nr:SDR family oxidoreductase [Siccirubricoccus soli]MCO6415677.1 SDR family oxidoreductase [Siccirubricoccus soli]MCP2681809.1 SDR family oxidoreductase [Siccirubricoccus soli]
MNTDWLGLGGKVAVVTGAGGGIGRACARSFVEAGASVMLLDLDAERLAAVEQELRAAGGQVAAKVCDTTSEASIKAAAEATQQALGPAEILVNNAGILRPGPLATLSLAEWNALLAVNLTGYLLCAQAFRPQMLAKKGGAIVSVASIAGRNPQPRSGAYSPSKAGVLMLSKQLALEWGPEGIRSNVVSPGLVRTPLSEAFYQAPGVAEKRAAMVPLKRVAGPQDMADAVLYLASPRASYVTGAEILVDGGLDQMVMELTPRPGF